LACGNPARRVEVTSLEAFCAKLAASGVTFGMPD
jgi:hypothetical protein